VSHLALTRLTRDVRGEKAFGNGERKGPDTKKEFACVVLYCCHKTDKKKRGESGMNEMAGKKGKESNPTKAGDRKEGGTTVFNGLLDVKEVEREKFE